MKSLKKLVLGCFLLIILVLGGAVVFIMTLDPNRLKPLLERGAAQKGLQLNMDGNISWQFYPNLGLSLGQIRLAHAESGQLMAEVSKTAATVQLSPLLNRQIMIDGVQLDGLKLFYTIEADGSSLWDSLSGPDDKEVPAEKELDTPELSIHKVRISNSSLSYEDKQNTQKANISIIKLAADNITLHGQSFPLALDVKVDSAGLPSLRLDWQNAVALNLNKQTMNLAQGTANVMAGGARLSLGINADVSWAEPLTVGGSIAIKPFELPPLLKAFGVEPPLTASPKALQKVHAAFDYQLKGDSIALKKVNVGIDDFDMKGQVSVNTFSAPEIKATFAGTSIVLDDYLPPQSDMPEGAKVSEPVNAAVPTPLPMAMLKTLNIDSKIFIEQIMYSGLNLDKNQINVSANNGLIKLDEISSHIAEGQLNAHGYLNAAGAEAKLKLDVKTQDVNVGQLLHTFAEMDDLQGYASVALLANSGGKTDQALMDNLVVDGLVNSKGLSVTPFNIEQQFCAAMALLQKATPPEYTWVNKTELEPVELRFKLASNNLVLEHLSAEIAHLMGAADGSINLQTGKFDVPLKLSLGDFAGDIQGCLPIKEKWRKQQLPIRCKGNLDNIGAKTCLPDTKLIGALIKEKLKAEFEEKREEVKVRAKQEVEKEQNRAEQKAKDKAKELLIKELGDEKAKNAEETLKGLFNQFKRK